MNHTDPRESPIDAQLAAPPPELPESARPPVYEPAANRGELLQSRSVVLAVLFLVTGALGIPLLWVNQKFSNAERVFWTVVVLIYTVLLIAGVGWIVWWAWTRIFH